MDEENLTSYFGNEEREKERVVVPQGELQQEIDLQQE
jgi:hypothetical protein